MFQKYEGDLKVLRSFKSYAESTRDPTEALLDLAQFDDVNYVNRSKQQTHLDRLSDPDFEALPRVNQELTNVADLRSQG